MRARRYGVGPVTVAVVHGGPGALGEMAPVARRLSSATGVVEPLLTAATVDGQVEACAAALREYAEVPAVLVGHSWGAWLSLIVAARYPAYVRKVVCVGSGPFEEADAAAIMDVRLGRLSGEERAGAERLMAALNGPATENRDAALAAFGRLMAKADVFSPISSDPDDASLPVDGKVFRRVWAEASALRRSGELLAICGGVRCPVTAIHGDYDPHPAAGVRVPLSRVLGDFRFYLLEDCGHCPWIEEKARERFYEILAGEIA